MPGFPHKRAENPVRRIWVKFFGKMEETASDSLQQHSLHFLEAAFRTDRQGKIAHPDGYGIRVGDCGDTIEIFLSVEESIIRRVSFVIDGCLNTVACANAIADLTEGRPVSEAWKINADIIARYLETLPEDHFHCAELASGAMYLALSDYQRIHRENWKKAYMQRV